MDVKSRSWLRQVIDDARKVEPYDLGETIEGLARKLNRDPSEILKLNSNENFFVPRTFLKSVLNEVIEEIDPRIYPRDEKVELEGALCRYLNVSPSQIVIGEGSDQLIDLVSRAFLKQGDVALSITPTFSMYEQCVRFQGGRFVAVPLKADFSLDADMILDSAKSGAKILFLCSPNNPTANLLDAKEIQRLIREFDGLVIVDEAYAEFANLSIVTLAGKEENLVVFRTFSKAFGLAGLRLGYAVSNSNLASMLSERFQLPYSATVTALKTARKLLERTDVIEKAIEEVKAERKNMIKALNEINGVHAFDSQTNFILMQVSESSKEVSRALLDRGVIVRNIGRVLQWENCLRVTVAPREMWERFITELRKVLNG